jgi:hypothetical protein
VINGDSFLYGTSLPFALFAKSEARARKRQGRVGVDVT